MHRPSIIAIFFVTICCATLIPELTTAQDSSSVSQNQYIKGHTAFIEGMTAFENENYREAVKLLSVAYKYMPDKSGISHALADTYLQLGDLSNASYYCKQAVEREPDNKWYRLTLADIYRHNGNLQSAIDQYKAVLNYYPDDSNTIFKIANTFAEQGELQKSNRFYNQLLNKNGSVIPVHLEKAENFKRMGLQDSVIAQFEKIRKLNPADLSTFHSLSNFYREMGKTEQAKAVLRQALEQNSRDPETLIRLADIYSSEAKWDSTGAILNNIVADKVIEPEPKLAIAEFIIAKFKEDPTNTEITEIASSLLDTFTELEPDYGKAHAIAATFYVEAGQNKKALQKLEKTNELLPSDDNAWRQRLRLLMVEQQYNTVLAVAPRAEEHVPQDPFVQYAWGSAYLAKEQYQPAVEKLKGAVSLPARRIFKSSVYTRLADAYAGVGNEEKANESYEKAIQLDPQNDTALNNYAFFLSEQGIQPDKAEKMALKALELSNEQNRGTYLDTAGWVYYQKGAYRKAEEFIKKAIESGANSADILEHLGHVYYKLGKPELAKEWWEKAYNLDTTRTYLKDRIFQ